MLFCMKIIKKLCFLFVETNIITIFVTSKQKIKHLLYTMANITNIVAEVLAEELMYMGAGSFNVEIDLDNMAISLQGVYEENGYTEDDYTNGTGAFVATSTDVRIDRYTIFADDEADNTRLDISAIVRLAEELI